MKTLYILRHAQKDEEYLYSHDYDIKLTPKGEEDAKVIGKKLKEKNILPDLIIASPAIRTKSTAQIVANKIKYTKTITFNEVFYQAYLNELIESITYTYDTVNTLMIVGHNPSLTALAISLGGFKEKLEMGNIVRIDFDCDSWIEISKSNGRFIEYIKNE